MLDPSDYKEPSCALCGGKEFYYPDDELPSGTIPVKRVIEKLDGFFERNDMAEAGRLLEYWQEEARTLNDKNGELAMVSELLGFYRKVGEKDKALIAVQRSMELLEQTALNATVSGATVLLNAATTLKAFGKAREALPIYDDVYKIYSAKLDVYDVRMGGFYNNKALALQDINDIDGAEKCFLSAIEVMKRAENGQLDQAISYVNLAHLYEQAGREKLITDCLFKAYELINDESIERKGYYAYVCSKCAPSFSHFGYGLIAKELKEVSDGIYERS